MEGQIEGDEEELGNKEGLAGADWPGEQVNTIGYDEDTIPAFDGGDGKTYDFSGINDDMDADVPDDSDMSLSEAPRSKGRKRLVCTFTTFLSHPANNFLHQLSNDPNDVTHPS